MFVFAFLLRFLLSALRGVVFDSCLLFFVLSFLVFCVLLLQMRVFAEKLQKYDITLASNQFEFSLVNQDKDEDGTLAECKRLGQCRNGSEDGSDTTVELPPLLPPL